MANFDIRTAPMPWNNQEKLQGGAGGDIQPEEIDMLFGTDLAEVDRGKFEDTYFTISTEPGKQNNEIDEAAVQFYNALVNEDNKTYLCSKLGLESEEYDALVCIALALASQETGMGHEERPKDAGFFSKEYWSESGYQNENGWFFGGIRNRAINGDSDTGSASSGLTQMKIYDIMQNDSELQQIYNECFEEMGIIANSKTDDNLYEEPDKAAVATIIHLKSLLDNYHYYTETSRMKNIQLGSDLSEKYGITQDEAMQRGYEIVSKIYGEYQTMNDEQKIETREAMQDWFIAKDGSTRGNRMGYKNDKYIEEIQLERLNKSLPPENQLTQEDLDFIRYFLTDKSMEMSPFEYLPYGWNKGSKVEMDRIFADVIGLTLSDPEVYNYNQHTPNVVLLSAKYAQQSENAGYETIDDVLMGYINRKYQSEN